MLKISAAKFRKILILVVLILPFLLAVLYLYNFNPPSKKENDNLLPFPKVQILGQDPVIVGLGDIACNFTSNKNTECQQQRVADLVEKINPDKLLLLGDLQYEKADYSDFINYFDKSFGRFKDKILPALGNHEYLTKGASGYFQYFPSVTKNYSFDLKNWHLISLDSNQIDKFELSWLESDLQRNQGKSSSCTLVFFHHPLFSSGQHGNNYFVKPIWEKLYQYQVDLVLTGHDHTYERFSPLSPQGSLDPESGITQFVVGTGGRNLYSFTNIKPHSEVRFNKTFGVLKLTLKENSADFEYLPIEGDFKDSGSIKCH